jgi:putative hemolysin
MFFDIALILFLIMLNGFFAIAELAMVSAREARLQALAKEGDKRAVRALRIKNKLGEFLATVQVGITVVATLASAFGGVEAANRLAPWLSQIPGIGQFSAQIALAIVVFSISYTTLIIGELVPKRLAIRQPERWALAVAGVFEVIMRLAIWPTKVLLGSADLLMRIFGDSPQEVDDISLEEVELLIRRGTTQGVFLPIQERLINRVFAYADRTTKDVMTPHPDMIALAAETSLSDALLVGKNAGFSRLPVFEDNLDNISGYVHIKDIIWADPDKNLTQITRPVVYIPENTPLPDAFNKLTRGGQHLGIVVNEFGATDGLITLEDLLEEIVGDIEDEHSPVLEELEWSQPGEWRVAGNTPIFEMSTLLKIDFDGEGSYKTLAGFIMAELEDIPREGDEVRFSGFQFLVESMERFRVQTVLIKRTKNGKQVQTIRSKKNTE